MALTLRPNTLVVTADDLVRFLDQPWARRVWTYQEVMLSTNPVIVCGQSTIPWWRFAMGILFLCSTTRLYPLDGESNVERTLARSLRSWRTHVVDRHEFQVSGYQHPVWADIMSTDLVQYGNFLHKIATLLSVTLVVLFYWLIAFVAIFYTMMMLGIRSYSAISFVLVFGVTCVLVIAFSTNLGHAVRRPRRSFVKFRGAFQTEELSSGNMLLSALWARECKEHKDFNFGIRNLIQALSSEALSQLDYARPLGDVYRDLTLELLRLTRSPEILLVAMKSNVAGQPSWVADWSRREPLRLMRYAWDDIYGLFYNPTAPALSTDSVRYDPSSPEVLQICAHYYGTVVGVLDLKQVDMRIRRSERAKHIHNLETLLELTRTRHHGKNRGSLFEYLHNRHGLEHAAFEYLRVNRQKQAAELLAVLQSSGGYLNVLRPLARYLRYFYTEPFEYGQSLGRVNYLTYRRILGSITATCNSVAIQRVRFIVVDPELAHWNSRPSALAHSIYLARCSSPRGDQDSRSSHTVATQPSVASTPSEECGPQIGDKIVRIKGVMDGCTVIRTTGNQTRFVDAVESLVFPKAYWEAYSPHPPVSYLNMS